MKTMDDFLNALENAGFKVSDFAAGMAGGLANLLIDDNEKPWWHRAFNVLAGAVTAGYCTPLVAYWLSLAAAYENAVAFLIGSIGLKLMDKILDFIDKNDIPTIIRLLIFKKRK
jgi:hypothetical protein